MDKMEFEPYGTAVAQWNSKKQQWSIDLSPTDISSRRPLFKALGSWLTEKGLTHSILQQRNNQLKVTAWKDEAYHAKPMRAGDKQ